jgi:hypothetical protein
MATTAPDAVWRRLLERLAAAVPQLSRQFVARVTAVRGYRAGAVTATELQTVAQTSLELIIDQLLGRGQTNALTDFAGDLGARRAQQGVPPEDLLRAVLLDGPLLWEALTGVAEEADKEVLLTRAPELWRVVDDYSMACHASYIRTRIRWAQAGGEGRTEAIAALFGPQGARRETQDWFARAFNVPADMPYCVLAVSGEPTAQMREAAFGTQRFLHAAPAHALLFWPVARLPNDLLEEVPAFLRGTAGGLDISARGLAGLAAAARRATVLADAAGSALGELLTMAANWQQVIRAALPEGVDLGEEIEAGLSRVLPAEAARLRETAKAYLATGSVAQTAATVYAHRNTVLARLSRFRELTGMDLRVPIQSARVAVAWTG